MDYTYSQWKRAQEWVQDKPSSVDTPAGAAAEIIRALPEPNLTLSEVHVGERYKYRGYRVDVNGERGWLYQTGELESSVLFPYSEDGGNRRFFNTDITLHPDEPRMTMPGFTPEPVTQALTTLEDFQNAPNGTIAEDSANVMKKSGNRWWVCGSMGWMSSVDAHDQYPHMVVVKWGEDSE